MRNQCFGVQDPGPSADISVAIGPMDIREITPTFSVTPMISPLDIAAIKEAGFTTLICNRPDIEVPPSHQVAEMEEAAKAAGLTFINNPVTHVGLTRDIVALQKEAIEGSDGPCLAYCASGTRSTIVWGLCSAPDLGANAVIDHAARAGYDLSQFRQLFASQEE